MPLLPHRRRPRAGWRRTTCTTARFTGRYAPAWFLFSYWPARRAVAPPPACAHVGVRRGAAAETAAEARAVPQRRGEASARVATTAAAAAASATAADAGSARFAAVSCFAERRGEHHTGSATTPAPLPARPPRRGAHTPGWGGHAPPRRVLAQPSGPGSGHSPTAVVPGMAEVSDPTLRRRHRCHHGQVRTRGAAAPAVATGVVGRPAVGEGGGPWLFARARRPASTGRTCPARAALLSLNRSLRALGRAAELSPLQVASGAEGPRARPGLTAVNGRSARRRWAGGPADARSGRRRRPAPVRDCCRYHAHVLSPQKRQALLYEYCWTPDTRS